MDRPWRGQLVEVTRDVAIERLDHGAVVLAAEWRARGTKDAASPDRAAADHTVTQLVTPSRVPVRRHGSGHSRVGPNIRKKGNKGVYVKQKTSRSVTDTSEPGSRGLTGAVARQES